MASQDTLFNETPQAKAKLAEEAAITEAILKADNTNPAKEVLKVPEQAQNITPTVTVAAPAIAPETITSAQPASSQPEVNTGTNQLHPRLPTEDLHNDWIDQNKAFKIGQTMAPEEEKQIMAMKAEDVSKLERLERIKELRSRTQRERQKEEREYAAKQTPEYLTTVKKMQELGTAKAQTELEKLMEEAEERKNPETQKTKALERSMKLKGAELQTKAVQNAMDQAKLQKYRDLFNIGSSAGRNLNTLLQPSFGPSNLNALFWGQSSRAEQPTQAQTTENTVVEATAQNVKEAPEARLAVRRLPPKIIIRLPKKAKEAGEVREKTKHEHRGRPRKRGRPSKRALRERERRERG